MACVERVARLYRAAVKDAVAPLMLTPLAIYTVEGKWLGSSDPARGNLIVPRRRKLTEQPRYAALRRIEEAVSRAFMSRADPGGAMSTLVELPELQDLLALEGVRGVFHHSPELLRKYGWLYVTRVGYVLDGDVANYSDGGKFGCGLQQLLEMGLAIRPCDLAHRDAATASLEGIDDERDHRPLRLADLPIKVLIEDSVDRALAASGGDLAVFLDCIRADRVSMLIKGRDRLKGGGPPAEILFRVGTSNYFSSPWFGEEFGWAGLVARGLRVNPWDPACAALLNGITE